MKPRKICHVITSLGTGGAEGNLVKLVINEKYHEHSIISLSGKGNYFEKLKKHNLKVYHLDFRNKFLILYSFLKLVFLIRKINPDIVQTWLYHADLIGGLAAKICFIENIFWNIRTSYLPNNYKKTTILTIKICSYLSWFIPKKIITCARSTISIHEEIGYCVKKFQVIFNGFNFPQKQIFDRKIFFKKLDISEKNFNIILVGRYSQQKDHNNFLKAINLLRSNYPEIQNLCINIILVGKDTNQILKDNKWFDPNILNINILCINNNNNIYEYFSHMDLSILSSSYGEAFPNVLAESMICGVPCIATDVGDSKKIIGEIGWIVKPSSPNELCKAIFDAIKILRFDLKKREILSIKCRNKISNEYSLVNMISQYKNLYSKIS